MSNFIDKLKDIRLVRAIVYAIVGLFYYPRLTKINKLKIEGTENIKDLPRKYVLFISNHQTYFAEVITFLHIFCAVKWGRQNRLGAPFYVLNPFTSVYFVSAAETMKKNWVTRLFELAGSITVKRTWNEGSTEVRQGLDPSDTRKIERALRRSWVINFPQGTTKPFAPGRKGTAFLIKQTKPIVIPIIVSGFNVAFDKKGLKLRKRGTLLTVKIKEPLQVDYNASYDEILETAMLSIGQSLTQQNPGATS